jgi:predicted MFS family arabinose efflux permease
LIRFTPRLFFQFSGLHSLLIGLLPFFLPILLWKTGTSLGEVSAFIALTGLGFIITLWFWDRLRASNQWRSIIAISFIIEIILVGLLAFDFSMPYLAGLALLNGAYNCFYWSTQRALFSDITTEHNTGKTFGNFQILVVVLLKLGILLGGYLLDTHGIGVIFF